MVESDSLCCTLIQCLPKVSCDLANKCIKLYTLVTNLPIQINIVTIKPNKFNIICLLQVTHKYATVLHFTMFHGNYHMAGNAMNVNVFSYSSL